MNGSFFLFLSLFFLAKNTMSCRVEDQSWKHFGPSLYRHELGVKSPCSSWGPGIFPAPRWGYSIKILDVLRLAHFPSIPFGRWFIPLFIGIQPSNVVQDFFHCMSMFFPCSHWKHPKQSAWFRSKPAVIGRSLSWETSPPTPCSPVRTSRAQQAPKGLKGLEEDSRGCQWWDFGEIAGY